ncbi:MAG: methylthioribulose 1-phosphate dehydratase [Cyanobacteria bacterium]|nr:methylthioribulose 1-phosphate dehydratase [Cyanobacteriota bacterium]
MALADELTAAMAAIHARGWCDGTGGNFSCVLQKNPLQLLMAPSGVDKGQVQASELIVVDAAGRVLAGPGKASAETALHLEIVARCGAGAVLHTHSQAATLLSRWALAGPLVPARGQAPEPISDGVVRVEGLEMLKGLEGHSTHATAIEIPVLANDQNLARLSQRAGPLLPDAPFGLLIAGHGLYAWGQSLSQANRHLEILEFLLEQSWRQLLLNALTGRTHPTTPLALG